MPYLEIIMLPLLRPRKIDLDELADIQRKIAKLVICEDRIDKLETIAGCDISFSRGEKAFASCVVVDYNSLTPLKEKTIEVRLKFPYIPTFLAFRELEGLLRAVKGLNADVYMVGAQGVAHPRRAGLACHLGVVLNRPTLGVAKHRLVGSFEEPPNRKGAYSPLVYEGEVVGAAVRTKENVGLLFVSVGHKLSLKTAIRIAIETTGKHRLPEPLFLAHQFATKAMKEANLSPS